MQIIYMVGVLKRRLPIPRQAPCIMRMLIETCWHQEAAMRPSFEDILPTLQVRAHWRPPPARRQHLQLLVPARSEHQSRCVKPE